MAQHSIRQLNSNVFYAHSLAAFDHMITLLQNYLGTKRSPAFAGIPSVSRGISPYPERIKNVSASYKHNSRRFYLSGEIYNTLHNFYKEMTVCLPSRGSSRPDFY